MNSRKRIRLLIMPALLVAVLPLNAVASPAAQPEGEPTTQSPASNPKEVPQASPDRAVLWDQYANYSGTDFAAQDFGAGYEIYEIFAADDFQNPEAWTISTIVTRGGWGTFQDLNNATAISWWICPDNGGEPLCDPPGDGNQVWSLSLPPADPRISLGVAEPEDVYLTLDTPIDLPAGSWWLVYQVSLEFGLYGQYGWSGTSDPVVGAQGMQNNPGEGFGMGTGWWDNSNVSDYMFRLEGTVQIPVYLVCDGPKVTFESGLPAPWTVLVNTGSVYWSTTDDLTACDNGGNRTLGGGEAACADSDHTNTGGDPYDTQLLSSSFDLSGGYPEASLQFAAAYNDIDTGDKFEVWVWDGGSWNLELQWDEDHNEMVTLDLSPYLGLPLVVVNFRYHGDGWDWWAQVDDVLLYCGAHIFGDGFESGNTSAWSSTMP